MEKRKLPSLVSVLILTLITAIMWVSFDVYRLFNKPATPSVPSNVSAPLSPTLDTEAITQLESKIFYDDSQIPDNVINPSVLTETKSAPAPTEVPQSSPIPAPENASGSGTGT